jgi:MraZ protein
MINLIGGYECKVDAKGRMLLPVALKRQLVALMNDGFVVKRSVFHQCLEMYPMSEWDKEVKGVNKLNRFVKKNNDFIRMFMAGVKVVEVDGSGRVLIPKDLVKFAGISKEIVLSSAINRIEIWDKDKYESVVQDESVDFGALAEDVMGGVQMDDEDVS